MSVARGRLLGLLEMVCEPLVLAVSLWVTALLQEGRVGPQHVLLALVVFALTFPGEARLSRPRGHVVVDILGGWLMLAALLFAFGHASGYLGHFQPDTLVTWGWAAPWCQLGAHFLLRAAAPRLREGAGGGKRALIAGMNDSGIELAGRLETNLYSCVRVVGFVDDRVARSGTRGRYSVLGRIEALPALVQRHSIDLVYLALPMATQPRTVALLDALRDTTASVYFVPDLFVTDLIQGRIDSISGMPVLGVCDSPFFGVSALAKRASDVVLASALLALCAPLLALLALLVGLTSRGPVIFRQRRCGLDGGEIIVYKFRTMTVTEDGDSVRQASREDPRVTRVGALMRRFSLDELPQLVNVLQGRMSLVGPRPHAVAHNQLYRKLIKGYMRRHKVRPGLTGWAQVTGLRGETDTLAKMQARIEFDLHYLRNWSLRLDLYIILKTLWVVLRAQNAY